MGAVAERRVLCLVATADVVALIPVQLDEIRLFIGGECVVGAVAVWPVVRLPALADGNTLFSADPLRAFLLFHTVKLYQKSFCLPSYEKKVYILSHRVFFNHVC